MNDVDNSKNVKLLIKDKQTENVNEINDLSPKKEKMKIKIIMRRYRKQ